MDRRGILGNVIAGVVAGIILSLLALLWNFSSSGGLVRALGGVAKDDLVEPEKIDRAALISQIKEEIAAANGHEVVPEPVGNAKSNKCPAGSFAVGVLFQIDSGGPHGIISNVQPVCRTLTK